MSAVITVGVSFPQPRRRLYKYVYVVFVYAVTKFFSARRYSGGQKLICPLHSTR